MIGWRFIKVRPTEFILHYSKGKLIRQGAGLSFCYFAPTSSLILIPLGSNDIPFFIREVTSDFQQVIIEGQLTYRVVDPIKLSQLMNFTLSADGKSFDSDGAKKLSQSLINQTQVLTRSCLRVMSLRETLTNPDDLVDRLRSNLESARAIGSLGIEILDLVFLSIKPTQEISRALEAEAREQFLLMADKAAYVRKNAVVEQERAIKENELNTEIVLENKKRQVKETQLDVLKSLQKKKYELRAAQMMARIALEEENRKIVSLATQNIKLEADAKAYGVSVLMQALAVSDPRIIQSLTCSGMDSSKLVALAFKELAEGTARINQFNISSELLRELIPKNVSL